jgi:hypothetical protein
MRNNTIVPGHSILHPPTRAHPELRDDPCELATPSVISTQTTKKNVRNKKTTNPSDMGVPDPCIRYVIH